MGQSVGSIGAVSDVVRYRCTSCGNLTRFDVVSTRRTRAYHHYSVGGELEIEDEQVLDEVIESAECRWCGSAGRVEQFTTDAAAGTDADAPVDEGSDAAVKG